MCGRMREWMMECGDEEDFLGGGVTGEVRAGDVIGYDWFKQGLDKYDRVG